MPAIAVFDTNILFSAVGWKGNPYQCVELARAGIVQGVTCREVLDELAGKAAVQTLVHRGAKRRDPRRSADISSSRYHYRLKAVAADPDDDKVLECATQGGMLA